MFSTSDRTAADQSRTGKTKWTRLATERQPYTFRLWAIYSLALLAGSLIPGKSIPSVALLGWDKLAHAVAFVGLAALTVPLVLHHRWWLWNVLAYGVLMAMSTEVLQLIPPGRRFSLYDACADMIGVGLYAAITAVTLRRTRCHDVPVPGEVISPNFDS